MKFVLSDLRRVTARWLALDRSVQETSFGINLQRARWLAPLMVVLNVIHVLAFYVRTGSPDLTPQENRWIWALIALHGVMAVLMAAGAFAAHHWRYAHRSVVGKWLPFAMVCLAMLFALAVAAVDQWVTPNITPFLIFCLVAGVVIYLPVDRSGPLYLFACLMFIYSQGLTQADAQLLLSNRLNGVAACLLGWSLSAVLWHKFTVITQQQAQLERINTEMQAKQRELERLTRQDGLTGLFNRNTFVELARKELQRAQRQGTSTVLLLLDLDHFKRVNDTFGHPGGDAVLRHVAAVALGTVRSTDLVGRLGGEEFIVLLPATSMEAARRIAEKLRARLQATAAPWEPAPISVTASMGLAGTTSAQNRDFDSLYSEADAALYTAKSRGRNRVAP